MPNIKITEKDTTTSAVAVSGQDVVFVPGFVNAAFAASDDYVDAYTPTLCDSVAQFETWFGSIPASFLEDQAFPTDRFASDAKPSSVTNMFVTGDMDPGYVYAKELLNAGLSVVFVRLNEQPLYNETQQKWYFASDSTTFYDTEEAANKTQISLTHMYDVLTGDADYDMWSDIKDMGEFVEMKYITSGGYPTFEYKAAPIATLETTGSLKVTSYVKSKLSAFFTGTSDVATITFGNNVIVIDEDEDWPTAPVQNQIYCKGSELKKHNGTEWVAVEATDVTWGCVYGSNPTATPIEFTTSQLAADTYQIVVAPTASNVGNAIVITYTVSTASTIVLKMIDVAASRGDCVALIDHTNNPYRTLNPAKNQSVYWSISNTESPYRISTDGSFASMFTPWCEYSFASDLKNSLNKNSAYEPEAMPASFGYLMALAKSVQTNVNWLAIAGAARGVVNITKPALAGNIRLSNTIADAYQPETGIAINPITNIKPYGYLIWGNRTLASNADGLVATSFLNTRNMISDIKKNAYKAAKKCMFEQNSDVLWVNYKSRITPMLDKMVTGNGLSGYKLIKETTEQKAQLKCTIRLYPIYAVESFDITVVLADDEVTVS